jgi:hypothetical protein
MNTAPTANTLSLPRTLMDQIRVPKSGQFLVLKAALKKSDIERVFDSIVSDLGSTPLNPPGYRHFGNASSAKNLHGMVVRDTVSLLIQPYQRAPLILPNSGLVEGRYAYLLLLQIQVNDVSRGTSERYLFIQREHASDPLEHGLAAHCTEIDPPAFLEQFVSSRNIAHNVVEPRIERLSMRMMASSRGEIRRKIIEAYDVASATSSLGLHRVIAGSMTLAIPTRTRNQTVAVSPHRQRVRAGSTRASLESVCEWARQCAVGFYKTRLTATVSSPFIAQMAQPLDELANKQPSSILIERHALLEDLSVHAAETGQTWHPSRSTPQGWSIDEVLETFSQPIELDVAPVDKNGNAVPLTPTPKEVFYDSCRKSFGFPKQDRAIKLRVTSRTCKIDLPPGAGSIGTSPTDKNRIGLAEFINRRKAFRVVFDNGRALYCSEGAYRTSNMSLATRQLTGIFEAVPDLAKVHTEKGVVNRTDSAFQPTSSFHFIENDSNITNPKSMLICDDSSVEWCDYIELDASAPRIRWLHAKVQQIELEADKIVRNAAKAAGTQMAKKTQPVGTNPSLSASDLEEVIGQAIKNLSRLRISTLDPAFTSRRQKWETEKCSLPSPGDITRLRRQGQPPITDIGKRFDEAASHPLAVYEVGIVVPNYSRSTLEQEFENIGKKKVDQSVLQAFWLLSSFMHACLEVGARPIVFLQP